MKKIANTTNTNLRLISLYFTIKLANSKIKEEQFRKYCRYVVFEKIFSHTLCGHVGRFPVSSQLGVRAATKLIDGLMTTDSGYRQCRKVQSAWEFLWAKPFNKKGLVAFQICTIWWPHNSIVCTRMTEVSGSCQCGKVQST